MSILSKPYFHNEKAAVGKSGGRRALAPRANNYRSISCSAKNDSRSMAYKPLIHQQESSIYRLVGWLILALQVAQSPWRPMYWFSRTGGIGQRGWGPPLSRIAIVGENFRLSGKQFCVGELRHEFHAIA